MKNISILAALLVLSCSMAVGQLSVRPQLGINFPTLTEDIAQGNWEGNVGYQFGLDVQFGGNIYVQPGLNFETTRLTVNDVGDLETSRINLPVMVGFRLLEQGDNTVGIRGFLGPNFAIIVNKSLDDAFDDINKDNIKDSHISGIVGGGVDLGIFFVDVGYKFGLNKFFDDINNDSKKHIFIVNAGLRLGR